MISKYFNRLPSSFTRLQDGRLSSRYCSINTVRISSRKYSSANWSQNATAAANTNNAGTVIPISEAKRFITECMVKIGTPQTHAEELSQVLLAADYRGHFSHGLNRLGKHTIKSPI